MYIWRKRATAPWLEGHEPALREIAGSRLAIIARSDRSRLLAEIAQRDRRQLDRIRQSFGGTVEKLSSDWLKRLTDVAKTKPLRIGRRLTIVSPSQNEYRNPNA